MPPLASMSLNQQQQQQQQPPRESYQASNIYYNNQQQQPPAPVRQPVHSPPAEARIQSWADNVTPQQPKPIGAPVATMQGMWSPDMGIKFAPPPGAGRGNPQSGQQQGGPGPSDGTWQPGSGIRFG